MISACGKTEIIDVDVPLVPQLPHPNPSVAEGDAVSFGEHTWLVLEVIDGKALVISEDILAERSFHLDKSSVTWETSELRQWLNGPFYDDTFTQAEKDRIVATEVTANSNPWCGTDGGNDTLDNVFLLCIEEVVRLFGDESPLDNTCVTEYIDNQYNKERIAVNEETGTPSWWWLRSPAGNNILATRVSSGGEVLMYTINGIINPADGGVRPALWLDLAV